jgi:nucleotide sugar dehydrogenase
MPSSLSSAAIQAQRRGTPVVIGCGVVGYAFSERLKASLHIAPLKVDKDANRGLSFESVFTKPAGPLGPVFLCLPTPFDGTGYDTDAIKATLIRLQSIGYVGDIVIRSTITPKDALVFSKWAVTERVTMRLHVMPEFLREASATEDALTQQECVFGRDPRGSSSVEQFVSAIYRTVHLCSPECAAMVKIMRNAFLATKVSFMNECYTAAEKLMPGQWDHVARLFAKDARVGGSHNAVPGPDAHLGFGGMCFPKDLAAMITMCEGLGTPSLTMTGAESANRLRRPELYQRKAK